VSIFIPALQAPGVAIRGAVKSGRTVNAENAPQRCSLSATPKSVDGREVTQPVAVAQACSDILLSPKAQSLDRVSMASGRCITVRITRLYTGPDGEAHFEDHELNLENQGDRLQSALMKATHVRFRETSGDYNRNWHNPPHRQLVIVLEGELEIQVGDGSTRRFGAGDVVLADDTTGRGHISRAVNRQRRRSAHVLLD
jgi:uncharacterized cupin superfamily protein